MEAVLFNKNALFTVVITKQHLVIILENVAGLALRMDATINMEMT
jgi:hypothetical protein